MPARRIALIALLVLAGLAAGATSASAHVYCVGFTDTRCSGPQRAATEAGLKLAIADAEADTDKSSAVLFAAPGPISINSPISVSASHPITLKGHHDSGLTAFLEWHGGPGTMLTFDNSAAGGARGSIEQFGFWAGGDATVLRVKSVDVAFCDFEFNNTAPGDTPTAIVADGSSHIIGGLFYLGGYGIATRGVSVEGPDVSVESARFEGPSDMNEGIVQSDPGRHVYFDNTFNRVANPLRAERGTAVARDDLIDLGDTDGATAAHAFNASGVNGSADVVLDGTTVAGKGVGQTALRATSTDPAKPARASMDSSLVDLRGVGALVASCALGPGGTGTAGVNATYSLFPTATSKRAIDSGCDSGAIDGTTNIDLATHQPIYDLPGSFRPAESSPVVDAGNPLATRPGALNQDSGVRGIFSIGDIKRIDIGAFEWSTSQALRFGEPVGRFKLKKKARAFRLTTADSVPRLPLNLKLSGIVALRLAKVGAGWQKGSSCRAKKPAKAKRKRCDLPLRFSQELKLPVGDSFLTFTGMWAHKKLKPGKYLVRAISQSWPFREAAVKIKLVR